MKCLTLNAFIRCGKWENGRAASRLKKITKGLDLGVADRNQRGAAFLQLAHRMSHLNAVLLVT